jgi:hypothetical protein
MLPARFEPIISAAADRRLRTRGHWDRQRYIIRFITSRKIGWVEVLMGKLEVKEPLEYLDIDGRISQYGARL